MLVAVAGATVVGVPALERVRMPDGPASILLPVGWTSHVNATGAASQSPVADLPTPSTLEISVAPVGETGGDGDKPVVRRPSSPLPEVLDAVPTRDTSTGGTHGLVCAEGTGPDHLSVGACARWIGPVLLIVKLSSAAYHSLGGLALVRRVLMSAEGFRNVRAEDLADPPRPTPPPRPKAGPPLHGSPTPAKNAR
jgi:hypothetical protein